jgi:polyisoprenoid-binding protein YceI
MRSRFTLGLFLSIAAMATASAATTTWTIDPNHSAAQFSVRHMMVSNVRGEFGSVHGTIAFDDQDASKSTIEATIDATTINTRVSSRDNDLKSENFFDVAKYPTITFKSTKVSSGGDGAYIVEGDLMMHGVTKPVTLRVEATPPIKAMGGERRGAEATTKLNRKDFGLSWNHLLEAGGAVVGDEVQITIDIEAVHKMDKPAGSK